MLVKADQNKVSCISSVPCISLLFFYALDIPLSQEQLQALSEGKLPDVLCCLGTTGRAEDLVQELLFSMGKEGGLSGFGLHIKADAEGSPGFVQPAMLFLQVQSTEP